MWKHKCLEMKSEEWRGVANLSWSSIQIDVLQTDGKDEDNAQSV